MYWIKQQRKKEKDIKISKKGQNFASLYLAVCCILIKDGNIIATFCMILGYFMLVRNKSNENDFDMVIVGF